MHIGVMGDLHGDLAHATRVLGMFADKGVRVILQLGDFGVIWPGDWCPDLSQLSGALAQAGQVLYFVDGNHEFFPRLLDFEISADGVRWVAWNIGHLPRGFRTRIGGGTHTLAALGGANSHDRQWRIEGESWWSEEQITQDDLDALGSELVDILVGHESPAGIRTRDETGASLVEMAYAHESQQMFRLALLQVRPQLTLGGHYHRHADTAITIPGNPPVSTRAVILDQPSIGWISQAILDPRTLDLEYFYRDGRRAVPRSELRNDGPDPASSTEDGAE